MDKKKKEVPSASFIIGAIALIFLIVGYQAALFINKAAVTKIVANHDHPDTVIIHDVKEIPIDGEKIHQNGKDNEYVRAHSGPGKAAIERKDYNHSALATEIRRANTPRRSESFRFDPNTASIDDLMRLGFTYKQAQAIDNYRRKGGRFRRKSDFAKSYVVEDSVYRRLEPYIDIPKIDLNTADSAAFETLPGIGKYFASKMVSYRKELGGYSYPEQLMDIWHFDQEKFDGLKDLIFINSSTTTPYPLWSLPEEQLAKHPYIGKYSAHSIIIFRQSTPRGQWSVEALSKAGILNDEYAGKLARCLIAPPE